jgi:outer membrane assembly lipoprotein YfiO
MERSALMRVAVKWSTALVLMVTSLGCAGGLPSIPNDPEAILAKGDAQFQKEKYFQAQELFKGFLAKFPGHERSDYAQFRLAESYFEDGEYPLAAVEYRVLISDYGYSEYVDDAFFKEALCFFKQAPGYRLDQTKSFEALSRFNQFLVTFPSSPLVAEAREYIARINETLAHKDLKNAKFYLRRRRREAARIYLDKVLKMYPDNDYWAEAMYLKGKLLLEDQDIAGAESMFEGVVAYPKRLEFTATAETQLERLKAR